MSDPPPQPSVPTFAFLHLDRGGRVRFLDGPLPSSLSSVAVGDELWTAHPALVGSELERCCRAVVEGGASRTAPLPPPDGRWRAHVQGRDDGLAVYVSLALHGARKTIRNSAVPVVDGDGRFRGAVVLNEDITAQRRAEQERERLVAELARQRDFLERLIQSASIGIAVLQGDENRYLVVNPAYAAQARRPLTELVGRTLAEALPPAAVAIGAELARVRDTGRPLSLRELPFDGAAGPRTWWDIDLVPLPLEEGAPPTVLLLSEDVTRDVLARQELEALRVSAETSLARLRAVLDILPLPVFVSDASGRLVEANPAARALWGDTRPQTDRPWQYKARAAWWPGSGEPVRGSDWGLARALATGEPCLAEEMDIETFTGERKTILNYAMAIRGRDGAIAGGVAVNVDITERRRVEEELRRLAGTLEQRVAERTAVAERRMRQLRALAAELTLTEQRERRRVAQLLHDHLQQLLVAARLRIGGLRRRVGDTDLQETVDRIDDLLDRAVQSSRSLTVELSPPVLHDAGLAAGLDWLARQMAEAHDLYVAVTGDRDLDAEDEATRTVLFEATRELLFNVVKHAGVAEAAVHLDRDETGAVRIRVSDEGRGFAVDDGEGSGERGGFGLFSVEHRLDLLGCRVAVDSAPGAGTRVVLHGPGPGDSAAEPPAVAETAPAISDAARPAERGGPVRVLVADDHEIVREGLVNLLLDESDVLVVGEAYDGVDAIEKAHALRPDVVVMDVTMPRLGGVEATRRLAAELPAIRVIGLSMHERDDMAAAMREAGAAAYLSKGGPVGDLLDAIRRR